jgi:hypothetical protein
MSSGILEFETLVAGDEDVLGVFDRPASDISQESFVFNAVYSLFGGRFGPSGIPAIGELFQEGGNDGCGLGLRIKSP